MNKKVLNALLLLIGAIGTSLWGINWHIGIAAWIAPIFLIMYTRNTKWYSFIFFFIVLCISGGVSMTSNNLFHLPSVNIINGISFGIFSSTPYIIDKLLHKRKGHFYTTFIFPASVVLVEFAVSSMIGTWGIIAHTQFGFKPLLHLSSLSGIFSISFMVAWFGSVINWMIEKKEESQIAFKGAIIYGTILSIVLIFGTIRFLLPTFNEETVKVATVISDTDIHKIADSEKNALKELSSNYNTKIPSRIFSDSISIKTLIKRTKRASKQGAKIIVWNEVALILNQDQKKQLISEVQSICSKEKAYTLLAFLEKCPEQHKKPFNNISVLISPQGETVWEYQKSFLHPQAEAPIINTGDKTIPTLQTEFGKIGNVICYDMDFNHYIKQAGKQAIEILLVPAYDWHEITLLHSQMASLEALQFGFNLVRSNGKGLSVIYDYRGNEIASMNTLNSNEKILYADLPLKSSHTVYSQIGDILIYLCLAFLIAMILKQFAKTAYNI